MVFVKLQKKNLFLIFILFVAAFLRLYQLGKTSLWFDEALTLITDNVLQKPWQALTQVTSLLSKQQPAALYVHRFLFYYWQKIVGLDEFKLRVLAAVFGILAVAGIYLLGKYLFNKKVGEYAALLLAFSPFHIYYSREVRQYSLISLLSIICIYLVVKAIYSNKLKYWVLLVVCLIFNIYMHYIDVLLLISNCILFMSIYKNYKKSIFNFIISHLITLFMLIPFFVVVTYFAVLAIYSWNTFNTQLSAYSLSIHIRNLFFTFKNFTLGYSINLFSLLGIISSVLFLGLFIFGLFRIKNLEKRIILLVYSVIPIFLVFFVSFYRVFYVDRHFIPFMSMYYLGIAYGIYSLKSKSRKLVLIIIIIFLNIGVRGGYENILAKDQEQRIAEVKKKDLRSLNKFLSENYRRGDIIMHTCEDTTAPLVIYSRYANLNNREFQNEIEKCRLLNICEFNFKNIIGYFEWGENIYDYPDVFVPMDFQKIDHSKNRIWLIYANELINGKPNLFGNSQKILNMFHEDKRLKIENIADFDGALLLLCDWDINTR